MTRERIRYLPILVMATFLVAWVASAYAFSTETKLLASDGGAYDYFGYSVSISGRTAIVGSILDDEKANNSGAAYVFTYDGSTWVQQAKLTPSDGGGEELFGVSVSISGDSVLVGARGNHNGTSGSAYVFVREGSTWVQQAKLTPSGGGGEKFFGVSVSISGDSALVGARGNYNDTSGSAYVFVREGSTWVRQAKLTPSDGPKVDLFGSSVSIDRNTAVVGARLDDDNGTNSGSTYVFVRTRGVWTEQAKLTASDGVSGDLFGFSVSISEDIALVGALLDDAPGHNSGSAYVFTREGTKWSQEAKLKRSRRGKAILFDVSVSISGNTALVGTLRYPNKGGKSGMAFVFVQDGETWGQQDKLIPKHRSKFTSFGFPVSIDKDTAVIGARSDDDNGINSGSAYVFAIQAY